MKRFERPPCEVVKVGPRLQTEAARTEMPLKESCRYGVEEKTGYVGCRKQKWREGIPKAAGA